MAEPAYPEYRRLLVPLDKSAVSQRIIPHVEVLARSLRAMVILLTVVELEPQKSHAVAHSAKDDSFEDDRHLEAAREYLDVVRDGLVERGVDAVVQVASGSAAETILDIAERDRADVICMATHGRGGIGRVVRGSVADEVLRHSHVPVLLVRGISPGR